MSTAIIERPSTLDGTGGLIEKAIAKVTQRTKELKNNLLTGKVKLDEIDRVEVELRELRVKTRTLKHLQGEVKRLMEF